MWWQNSDPQSQISSTSFALTSPNARDFFKVESLHAKIALLEKQDFKEECMSISRRDILKLFGLTGAASMVQGTNQAAAAGSTLTFTILHSNDTHDHLEPPVRPRPR